MRKWRHKDAEPSLFQNGFPASPYLGSVLKDSWVALLCLPEIVACKISVGEVLGPVFSAYTYSPAGMEAGGGAGQLQECHPLCEQTAQCQPVDGVWVKAHGAPGVQVWSSVLGVSVALGWSDLEAWLPLTMSHMGLRQDWASPTCLRVVPGQGQV